MKLRIVFFWVVVLLLRYQANAQQSGTESLTTFDKLGYAPSVPPSPGAAALGKYGQFEVNLAYGVPDISIPLFEVNSGSLRMPASLSYHAGGNKASDEGSWVGLGWTLNLGGVITRSVRGLADEMDTTGNFMHDMEWYQDYAGIENHTHKYREATMELVDTEPDHFNFNFGGYSGGFFFNNNGGAITVLPFQALKIGVLPGTCPSNEWFPAGSCVTFKITTPDGVEYYFEEMEISQSHC